MFEGTGDLRNDVDELIYLSSVNAPDGNGMLLSTNPDKVSTFNSEPVTYRLQKDRTITIESVYRGLKNSPAVCVSITKTRLI